MKKHFIALDKRSAIIYETVTGNIHFFEVGDVVKHDDDTVGLATIVSFEESHDYPGEVKVNTTSGYAHLDFIIKLNNTSSLSSQMIAYVENYVDNLDKITQIAHVPTAAGIPYDMVSCEFILKDGSKGIIQKATTERAYYISFKNKEEFNERIMWRIRMNMV